MKVIHLAIMAFLLTFGTACKVKKGLESSKTEGRVNAESIKKRLIKNQFQADWLVGRAKIGLDGGSFAQSGTIELRIRKDSVIWMSVRKFGIEAARALITQDSIFLLERLNRRYAAEDLSFINEEYNLPASFGTLQAILLGNPIFLNSENMQLNQEESQFILENNHQGRKSSYQIQAADYRLQSMSFEEVAAKQKLTNTYQDYRALEDGQNFSYFRQINVKSPSAGALGIKMEFSKVEINVPTTIRFEIPKQYTKMQ